MVEEKNQKLGYVAREWRDNRVQGARRVETGQVASKEDSAYLVEELDNPPDDSNQEEMMTQEEPPEYTKMKSLVIYLHASAGNEVPQLMHLEGRLRGRDIGVSVDMGSTQFLM
ncbi:unnamed protein product [Victoria cruziana]